MAKGYFRTSSCQCLYCGTRNKGTKIYKRGRKNSPDYLCESCFDGAASIEELSNKEKHFVREL
jgi:hypothetical protein